MDSRPSSASSRMAAAVNCLLTDASRKLVAGDTGVPSSTTASP